MNVRKRTPLTTLVPWTDIDVLQKIFSVLFHMRSPRLSMLLCGRVGSGCVEPNVG